MEVLRKAYNEGKLKNTGGETIVKAGSLEDVPKIWYRLFQGKNIGKLLTELP
jgi:NADPH-dependent curcumin reductase CurA